MFCWGKHRSSDGPLLEQLEPRLLLDGAHADGTLQLFDSSPALFVRNQGQWADPSIHYALNGSGANVAFTDSGLSFHLFQDEPVEGSGPAEPFGQTETVTRATHFSVVFDGANVVAPVGVGLSAAVLNYFVGDQTTWRTNVEAYEAVCYRGLYDGIDLNVWPHDGGLKYEFRVAAGADYGRIQITYGGVEGLSIDEAGALHVHTELGELVDKAPLIYHEADGGRVEIGGGFKLIDANTVSFGVAPDADLARELIIDPELDWARYLGGSAADEAWGIAVDSAGNVLVSGETRSPGWISGQTHAGSEDAFVAKLAADGQLLWASYLGGSAADTAYDVAVDNVDHVLLSGDTKSSDLAGATNGYHGTQDAFVAKFNPSGGLLWSTYVGGADPLAEPNDTILSAIDVGLAGDVEFAASLEIGDNPHLSQSHLDVDLFAVDLTPGDQIAVDVRTEPIGSDLNAYVRLFNRWGHEVAADDDPNRPNSYLTYTAQSWGPFYVGISGNWNIRYDPQIEGSGKYQGDPGSYDVTIRINSGTEQLSVDGADAYDIARAIAVNSSGHAVVGGYSSSDRLDKANNSPHDAYDAFVGELSGDGELLWSTYVGGNATEYGLDVAVDDTDSIFVAGYTYSDGWVAGGFSGNRLQNVDGFVAKLSSCGTALWSSYVGAWSEERCYGVATDQDGNVLLTGSTGTSAWLSGGSDITYNGGKDAFVLKVSGDGQEVLWGTYVGGGGLDSARGIAVDPAGNAIITGETRGEGWAYDVWGTGFIGGARDPFVAVVSSAGEVLSAMAIHGEADEDYGRAVAVSPANVVYVAGETDSELLGSCPHGVTYNGGGDGFVAKVSTTPPWAPFPDLLSVEGVPESIQAWEPFTVTVTAENGFGFGQQYSSITASVLYEDGTDNLAVSDPSTDCPGDATVFRPGLERIYHRDEYWMDALDHLIEAVDEHWVPGEQHTMSFTVTPKQAGKLWLRFRTTMSDSEEDWYSRPWDSESETLDQQGWEVLQYEAEVTPAVPTLVASGCTVFPDTVRPGERLTIEYEITNPTDEPISVGLGASIRPTGSGQEGWRYDQGHDEYEAVAPGTATYERSFDIAPDAEPGSYDVAWGLWETIDVHPMWDYLEKESRFEVGLVDPSILAELYGAPHPLEPAQLTYAGKTYTFAQHAKDGNDTIVVPYETTTGVFTLDTAVRDPDLAAFLLRSYAFRKAYQVGSPSFSGVQVELEDFAAITDLNDPWYVDATFVVSPVLGAAMSKRLADNAVLGTFMNHIASRALPSLFVPASAPKEIIWSAIGGLIENLHVGLKPDELKFAAALYQEQSPSPYASAILTWAGLATAEAEASLGLLKFGADYLRALVKIVKTNSILDDLFTKWGDYEAQVLVHQASGMDMYLRDFKAALRRSIAEIGFKLLSEYIISKIGFGELEENMRAIGAITDVHFEAIHALTEQMLRDAEELESLYAMPSDTAENRTRIRELEKRYAKCRGVYLYGLLEEMTRSQYIRYRTILESMPGPVAWCYGASPPLVETLGTNVASYEARREELQGAFIDYLGASSVASIYATAVSQTLQEPPRLSAVGVAAALDASWEVAAGTTASLELRFVNTLDAPITEAHVSVESGREDGIVYAASLDSATIPPQEEAVVRVSVSPPYDYYHQLLLPTGNDNIPLATKLPITLEGTVAGETSYLRTTAEICIAPRGHVLQIQTDRTLVPADATSVNVEFDVAHDTIEIPSVLVSVLNPSGRVCGFATVPTVNGHGGLRLEFAEEEYGPYGISLALMDENDTVVSPWFSASKVVYRVPPVEGNPKAVTRQGTRVFVPSEDLPVADRLVGSAGIMDAEVIATDAHELSVLVTLAQQGDSIILGVPEENQLLAHLIATDPRIDFVPTREGNVKVQVLPNAFGGDQDVAIVAGMRDREVDLGISAFVAAWPEPVAPTDVMLDQDTVDENSPVGTVVGHLLVVDPDEGDTHTLTFVEGDGDRDNSSFVIEGDVLKTDERFDFETGSLYDIRVSAVDQNGLELQKALTISVMDVNEEPTGVILSNAGVPENEPAGTEIGTLTTIDPDREDQHVYTLPAGLGDNDCFYIDGDRVKTGKSFDYEAKSSYVVHIRSTDAGGLSTLEVFPVGVIDVDETAPTVQSVLGSSTLWASDFLTSVGGDGYVVPTGSDQLAPLPWGNVDRVRIAFSEDVVVGRDDLVLSGISEGQYAIAHFDYDGPARMGTWTLANAVSADRLTLALSDQVADAAGNALDGDWTDAESSFPSGDGEAGGEFRLTLNVLPGDADQSGTVDCLDYITLKRNCGTASGAWFSQGDFSGDGSVGRDDFLCLREGFGKHVAAPTPPSGHLAGPFLPGTGNWTVVPNGGFEMGDLSEWTRRSTPSGGFEASDDQAAVGAQAAKAVASAIDGEGFTLESTPVAVVEGRQYVLSGFFHAEDVSSGKLYIDLTDAPFEVNVLSESGLPGWQFAWGTFTVTDEFESVIVRTVRGGPVTAGEHGYFDEIAVTPASQFLPPSVAEVDLAAGLEPSGVLPGDLDADGRLDLAKTEHGTDEATVSDGIGSGWIDADLLA